MANPEPQRDEVTAPARIGYVLKCYPRFSETFIVREILAREAAGEVIAIASLRSPRDTGFHPMIGDVKAPITWIRDDSRGLTAMWEALARFSQLGPAPSADALRALVAEEAEVAAQAVHVAVWARESQLTHLHAHFLTAAGRTARLAALLTGLPWTVTAHAKDIFSDVYADDRRREVLADADTVIAVSDATADYLRGLGVGARVRRIYNGVEVDELARLGEAARAELPELPLRVCAVGRLVAKKGWPILLDALAQLRDRGIELPTELIGSGPLADSLREQRDALGLTELVELPGALPQQHVLRRVATATLLVAPCIVAEDGDRDGLPTVLLEAMALGTPVLSTPVAGIAEAVVDGSTGVLVAPDDVSGLAEALADLAADAGRRGRLAAGARRHVATHFDVAGQARTVGGLCRELRRDMSPAAPESTAAPAAPTSEVTPLDRDVIYVVTDPGVPVFGHKGCSTHVQAVLTELHRRARAAGRRVTLVATRLGGTPPPRLEGVDVIELPAAAVDRSAGPVGTAAREAALRVVDEEAARIVTDLVTRARATGPAPLVYQRYSLFSAAVMEEASVAGARTVLEVNAPLVDEQAQHRELVDRDGAVVDTRRALRAAELVYAVSSGVAAWAEELSDRPVPVLPNGVDLADYPVARPSADAAVPEAGAEAPLVAFVGGFRPWHDPEQLVRAAAMLSARGTPVRLLLVGAGPCLPDVLAAAACKGVAVESVGAVSPERVPALLARANIAVAPYPAGEAYFSPLKIAEYLAAGLPTVVSAVADLPDLLAEYETVLVPPGDLDAFTDALGALASDPARRQAMGVVARAAASRFTWTGVVDRMLGLLGDGDIGSATSRRTVVDAADDAGSDTSADGDAGTPALAGAAVRGRR